MIEEFIDSRGTLLRRDVIAAGLDDNLIARAKRDDVLLPIHHGGYCRREIWEEADRSGRHRLRSHVVQRLYDDRVARSHVSSLLELDGPDWGLDLSKVHLTNLYGVGERTQSKIVHHRGAVLVDDLTRRDFSWLTSYARTALDTAALAPRDPAVCVLNWVEASGHATREELERGIERMKEWPQTVGLIYKLRLSNGKGESILETRGDLMFRDLGLPMFKPQHEVHHPSGLLAARLDGAWPHLGRWVEFDGLIKYLKNRRPGETIEQCVLREKAREDMVRRLTGWMCLRLDWYDVDHPAQTDTKIRAFLSNSYAA